MNRDEVHVEHLVDLQDLGLSEVTERNGRIGIGAKVTYSDVIASGLLQRTVPLLPRMARGVTGGRQLTQQATLVGAACHNYPGTDVPGTLVALDATLRPHGLDGIREVAASDFLLDAQAVDVRAGEFVSSFVVNRTNGRATARSSTARARGPSRRHRRCATRPPTGSPSRWAPSRPFPCA